MEMALLRLMHLRKLVPLTDLLTGAARCGRRRLVRQVRAAAAARGAAGWRRRAPDGERLHRAGGPRPLASVGRHRRRASPSPLRTAAATAPRPRRRAPGRAGAGRRPYRDAFLAELKAAKPTFYNLVVAQAFSIDANASGVTFAFQPNQKVPKAQCEDNRAWVQGIVEKVTGAKLPVHIVFTDAACRHAAPPPAAAGGPRPCPVSGERKTRGPRARDRAAPARDVPGREDHGAGRVGSGIRGQGSGSQGESDDRWIFRQ